jgi:uncharacterized protein (TIGR03435 family)
MLAHLTDVSIRSLVLALIAVLVLLVPRCRRTAALQHAVWTAVVCGMLALFAFGTALPRLPLRALDRPAVAPLRSAPRLWETPIAGAASELPAPVPAARRRSTGWSNVWSKIALYAYAAIAFAFLARFLTGMLLARRLLTRSSPAAPGFHESAMIAVPLTIGVTRPKILLPLEWRDWNRDKLNAVLAHEGAHVRRRDGLVSALAGINRCIFWFHPLAWWMERRLVLLAELACDESCVAALGNREEYARLLLDMARVVDGAHGRLQSLALTMAAPSHLRRRIDSILEAGRKPSRGLSRTGWAAIALCGIPVVFGAGTLTLDRQPPVLTLDMPRPNAPAPPRLLAQARPTQPAPIPASAATPKFEVAAIRPSTSCDAGDGGRSGSGGGIRRIRWSPGRLNLECQTVADLIRWAYLLYANGTPWPVSATTGLEIRPISFHVLDQPIKGSPAWINSDRYTIDAKAESPQSQEMMRGPMMQALLEDRFKLKIHREVRDVPVYELTVAKGGPKLQKAREGGCITVDFTKGPPPEPTPGQPPPDLCGMVRMSSTDDGLDMHGVTMADLCAQLSVSLDHDIVDKTATTGVYDVHLELSFSDLGYTPTDRGGTIMVPTDGAAISVAVQKLGLKLERANAPGEFLVIDNIERPSEN